MLHGFRARAVAAKAFSSIWHTYVICVRPLRCRTTFWNRLSSGQSLRESHFASSLLRRLNPVSPHRQRRCGVALRLLADRISSMKQCLADVNILLALLVLNHEHHVRAGIWFDSLTAHEVGLCRPVQLALIRLIGNKSVMGIHAVSSLKAWNLIEELLQDERVDFIAEPTSIDTIFPSLLKYAVPTTKLVGDAFLAAFAIAASRTLVTLDSGFRQFRGLDVLVPA
jgi:toxin-antitoxin system PIN domain toxin